ncbi:NAD(P)H-binding protein [Leifsonia sp. F6_8S_P_1B]|uniref:NAD(P)H-binding protein n=1 Tax=Leifsonia williamsii TaxID=3035919 RepID=A0ABT8KFS9_9MICO|nr:NAD(P)H-binding protein [Leifsonia williamsii]MDN4616311.1 NAD(P)H-binding protein [Leifsonia williamsii]
MSGHHILITGATGRLGGAIVATLADRAPGRVHALVRRAGDARAFADRRLPTRAGDYDDPATLAAAFAGIDTLVFVSSPALDPGVRVPQHRAVVEAALTAGVRRVVYTSAFGAQHDPGHATTEGLLLDAFDRDGRGATILRNGFYTEPFVERALAEAEAGRIASAAGDGPLATASLRDLAEAAAAAALRPPREHVLELRGPAWTYDALAAALAAALGRPVAHERVAPEAAGPLGPLQALAARGLLAAETGDLAALLGRPPRGIVDVVRDAVP